MFSGFRSVWMRLRSCRTIECQWGNLEEHDHGPTSHTCEELTCKTLDLRAGKGHKAIAFEKIKDALTQKIGDNTDVVPKVE